MSDEGVCRPAPATPGLLKSNGCAKRSALPQNCCIYKKCLILFNKELIFMFFLHFLLIIKTNNRFVFCEIYNMKLTLVTLNKNDYKLFGQTVKCYL